MGPNHKGVINMSKLAERFVCCPVQCIFEVLHDEAGNHRLQQRTHGHSIGLFIEQSIETEKQGQDIAEKSHAVSSKVSAQEIQSILNWYPGEE
jgi:hypothetical protein